MTPSSTVENAPPPAAPGALKAEDLEAAPAPEAEAAAPEAGAADDGAADDGAWAEVVAAWDDEARHRAYLDRARDLDGLAAAGRRYQAALAASPGDPVAARFREEVIRRAVAHGLASIPRTPPEHGRAKLAVRVAAGALVGALLLAAALMAARLVPYVASGARP